MRQRHILLSRNYPHLCAYLSHTETTISWDTVSVFLDKDKVYRTLVDLLNVHPLLEKNYDHLILALQEVGWDSVMVVEAMTYAASHSNWRNDDYIVERLEGAQAKEIHRMGSRPQRLPRPKSRMPKQRKVTDPKTRKYRCTTCGGRNMRKDMKLYGHIGILVCSYCAGWLYGIRKGKKTCSTSNDSAMNTESPVTHKDGSSVVPDGSNSTVPSAPETQDLTSASS